jgi:hypothetical protein
MRKPEDIIDDWKVEFGTLSYGKHGSFYRYIDWKIQKNLLMNLVQTFIDEGYKKEDLIDQDGDPDRKIQMDVVSACSPPDGASSRKKVNIDKSKKITAKNWKESLKEFFRGPVSTFSPQEHVVEYKEIKINKTLEEKLDVELRDRIKVDTSDVIDLPLDSDFLSELGIDESFITGKKDE